MMQPKNEKKHPRALDLLKKIAQKHHFEIKELYRDEIWVTNKFVYREGLFVCQTVVDENSDDFDLYFESIPPIPYTPENYETVRDVCNNASRRYRYGRVVYQLSENTNEIGIDIIISGDNPTEKTFMKYLHICLETATRVALDLHLNEVI